MELLSSFNPRTVQWKYIERQVILCIDFASSNLADNLLVPVILKLGSCGLCMHGGHFSSFSYLEDYPCFFLAKFLPWLKAPAQSFWLKPCWRQTHAGHRAQRPTSPCKPQCPLWTFKETLLRKSPSVLAYCLKLIMRRYKVLSRVFLHLLRWSGSLWTFVFHQYIILISSHFLLGCCIFLKVIEFSLVSAGGGLLRPCDEEPIACNSLLSLSYAVCLDLVLK